MTQTAQIFAVLVAVTNAAAGLLGAWRWYTVEPSRAFWVLARVGQGAAVVQALAAGLLAVSGFEPASNLYWLYALLPVAVSFVAEQLRIASAQAVLDARGLPDAQAVGALDERGQRSVVLAIVRREMGVIAAAGVVIAFLALRALGTV
jgi:hypothetical protein